MTTVAVFGVEFSRRLVAGAEALGVPVEFVAAVLSLESGWNPTIGNPSGARGLYQQMPTNGVPYPCPAPEVQIQDAFRFWRSMMTMFKVTGFETRAAFYCLNLAPARLAGGRGTLDRVLYSSRRDLHPAEYAPKAYDQNRGLDPIIGKDAAGKAVRKGWIELRDLEPGLAGAVRNCRARYDAELAAARALAAPATVPLPSPSDPPETAEGTRALASAMVQSGTRMAVAAALASPPLPSILDDDETGS